MKNLKFYLVLPTVLSTCSLALAVLALCFSLRDQFEKTPEEIWDSVKYSTLELKAVFPSGIAYGSALVVNDSNTLITCRHLIVDDESGVWANDISVRSAFEDEYYPAVLLKSEKSKDLAFLSCTDKPSYWKPADSTHKEVYRGETVFSVGNALNTGLSFTEGTISLPKVLIADFDGVSFIQSSVSIAEGCSGGGLFDTNGKLIGMHCFQRRNPDGSINQNFAYSLPSLAWSEQ